MSTVFVVSTNETANILNNSTDRSLIILDETILAKLESDDTTVSIPAPRRTERWLCLGGCGSPVATPSCRLHRATGGTRPSRMALAIAPLRLGTWSFT